MDLAQLSREVHKQVRRPKVYRPVIVSGIDDVWGVDLVSMQFCKDENDGYEYILGVVDCFSRYAWYVPLKRKTGVDVWAALNGIMTDSKREPHKIWADQGTEFLNKTVLKKLEAKGISIYHTYSKEHCSVIERLNRTLKGWMFKKFTEQQSHRWLDILPGIMASYNKRKHRMIEMSPTDASRKENEKALWMFQYGQVANPPIGRSKFKVGDKVRVSLVKGDFQKGYEPSYSYQVYTVRSVDAKEPIMYTIEDYKGRPYQGSFYESELQKTEQKPDEFLVQEILKTRTRKGIKEVLVKWLGYDEDDATWEPASSIIQEFN